MYLIDESDKEQFIYILEPESIQLTERNNESILKEVSAKDTFKKAKSSVIKELNKMKPIITNISQMFDSTDNSPNELVVEFGISITSSIGAVLVTGDMEATFKIKAVWKRN